MEITLPDPHPGRCRNYRDGQRCLDYDGTQHVCTFPEKPTPDRHWSPSVYTSSAARPKPWVKPETVFGCDEPNHPANYAHTHETAAEVDLAAGNAKGRAVNAAANRREGGGDYEEGWRAN